MTSNQTMGAEIECMSGVFNFLMANPALTWLTTISHTKSLDTILGGQEAVDHPEQKGGEITW